MAEKLTRSFFEEELRSLADAYGAETGAQKVVTELLLRDGATLRMEGQPTCTDRYLMFDYKSGNQTRRAVVPYGSITAVAFAGDSTGSLGFHR